MKTLVLTIPEQPHRAKAAAERLAKHQLDFHFVQGINGVEAGLRTVHTYEYDNPGSGYTIGPKTIGIFLGHYIAWAVRDYIPDQHVLILEDDAIVGDNFVEQMNACIANAPHDFDFLFLGSCCTEGHQKIHVNTNIYELKYPQCLHAYVLSKNGAKVLLQKCRDINGPVDCVLRMNQFYGLKVYTVLPRIVDQFETVIPP